jgi:LmbE family N-acetylglucosaminyl deacetylase
MSSGAPLTLMAVHAHPDDEASSTGGVLAKYSAEGVRTIVVTCTNGEYGDGPGGIKPGEDGHDPLGVARTRRDELDRAIGLLGVTHLERLGYHDSGMNDWPYKDQEHPFCNVPLSEAAEKLVELFDKYEPQVVVTYDENGGYGHPDHVQTHRITVAAIDKHPLPAKLYFTARRRRDFAKIRELMAERGIEMPATPAPAAPATPPDPVREAERAAEMERREARITTDIDVSAFVDNKRAALAAHASQVDNTWWMRFPPEAFSVMFAKETFIRARDTTGAPVPEDDLFAGLRA